MQINPLLKPAVMKGGKMVIWCLNCSTAALTQAGCHSHRSPSGGAGTACLHGDPDPWPSQSPGSVWDRGSRPPHWGSGKSCCSAPRKTWIQFRRKVVVWDVVTCKLYFFSLFCSLCPVCFPPTFLWFYFMSLCWIATVITGKKHSNQHKLRLWEKEKRCGDSARAINSLIKV